MKLTGAEKTLLAATAIGFLHHVDHVLRLDHSGWPFRAGVTPFTYSLIVYPIIASAFLIRQPLWQGAASFAVFAFATFSHSYFETPADQYRTWAHGSPSPGYEGVTNLLGVQSQALGVLAAGIGVLLSVGFLAAAMLFFRDAMKARRVVA